MISFGDELRRERELRDITLREVEQATKISIRYLQALERNEFGELPGGVFNKGFVRAYCDYIGVDGEAMVNAYLHEARTQVRSDRDEPHPFRRQPGSVRGDTAPTAGSPSRGRRRWVLVVMAALVLAATAGIAAWFALVRPHRIVDSKTTRPSAQRHGTAGE